jgi:protein TonB
MTMDRSALVDSPAHEECERREEERATETIRPWPELHEAGPEKEPNCKPPAGLSATAPAGAHRRHDIFEESLLEMSTTRPKKRVIDFIASIFAHTLVLSILILLPLYFTEAIDLKQFTQTLLVAPPPPPPPPPPASPAVAKIRQAPKRVFTSAGKLLAPMAIPQRVAMLKEEPIPDDPGVVGVIGGVPGGVPGGQMGGVLGGIIGGVRGQSLPPPPKAAAPKAPIRVGGRVKAPRPISTPQPLYPVLARGAKIEGDVVIDAVIDTTGNVVEMRVINGHPLLIQSAMNALKQWRYEPTYLNEEPVSVQLMVTIRFRLSG